MPVNTPITYSCGDGYTVRVTHETTLQAYTDAVNTLVSVGWQHHDRHRLGGNRFDTLRRKRGGDVVFAAYYAATSTSRFVSGRAAWLPPLYTPQAPSLVTPTVTQLARRGATQSAAGLSLVIQLCDGRFVLIDGGPRDEADTDALYAFLTSRTPHERPLIAAWFITHAHKDHVGLAGEFLTRYGDDVELQLAAYNFPDFSSAVIEHESAAAMADFAAPFEAALRKRGTPVWRVHSGQRMALSGGDVTVLYTHEEHGNTPFPWGNHTSSAFLFTFENKQLLVLGDCETVGCTHMARHFGDTLACDILQTSHHGLNGACEELYRRADPAVCLWPIDATRFHKHPICRGDEDIFAYNRYLRDDSIRKRAHYTASETVTLPL